MKRKRVLVIYIIILIPLLISIISASILTDFWNKITGNAVSGNTATCTDSDGGGVNEKYVKGDVVLGDKTYTDQCDLKNKTLTEYSCSKNKLKTTKYNCQGECMEGMCLKYNLTCANYYYKSWHKQNCSQTTQNPCGNDVYERCMIKVDKKITYYREVCKKEYSTGCLENPKCNKGDTELTKRPCIKLKMEIMNPKDNSEIEAFGGEAILQVNTNINAVCSYGLFKQVQVSNLLQLVQMNLTGEKYHEQSLTKLLDKQVYLVMVECKSEDTQIIKNQNSFSVKIPEIKGFMGILTEKDVYGENEQVKLIS